MITEQDALDIMRSLVEFDGRLRKLEDRMDAAEHTLTAHEAAFVPAADYTRDQMVNYNHIDSITARLSDLTGLPAGEVLWESRIGDRMTAIEEALARHDRLHIDILRDLLKALIEVKGQISDPIHKTSAIDRLRVQVKDLVGR